MPKEKPTPGDIVRIPFKFQDDTDAVRFNEDVDFDLLTVNEKSKQANIRRVKDRHSSAAPLISIPLKKLEKKTFDANQDDNIYKAFKDYIPAGLESISSSADPYANHFSIELWFNDGDDESSNRKNFIISHSNGNGWLAVKELCESPKQVGAFKMSSSSGVVDLAKALDCPELIGSFEDWRFQKHRDSINIKQIDGSTMFSRLDTMMKNTVFAFGTKPFARSTVEEFEKKYPDGNEKHYLSNPIPEDELKLYNASKRILKKVPTLEEARGLDDLLAHHREMIGSDKNYLSSEAYADVHEKLSVFLPASKSFVDSIEEMSAQRRDDIVLIDEVRLAQNRVESMISPEVAGMSEAERDGAFGRFSPTKTNQEQTI